MKESVVLKVKGVCRGIVFAECVNVTLIPPMVDSYGTGCHLLCEFQDGFTNCVDVRYERTKDVKELARRWARCFWGKNAREITVE